MKDDRSSEKAFAEALRALCADDLPAEVALMRLILVTKSAAELDRLGEDAVSSQPATAGRVRTITALGRRYAHVWPAVRAAAAAVRHHPSDRVSPDEALQKLAADFDMAATVSPEASVALYSFGDPDRLKAATEEIVEWMWGSGLLRSEHRVLDIGCGIGRLERALCGTCREIVGVDISPRMVDIARRRCTGLEGIDIRLVSGLGLQEFEDACFDLVIAVDTLPYLVSVGGNLAERHFADAARVLRRAGNLLVLNYSYRGSLELDRCDIRRHANGCGLEIIEEGLQPFRHWDGAVFQLRRN
ncbi:MAG TPA: methyltransferase domain-containing protein [Rhizobiaceae bacterium]|nr:methyltransferase domain-containing protein [Rhizobiaceae bacterium]